MKNPAFVLQSGDFMRNEKFACVISSYPTKSFSYEQLSDLDPNIYRLNYVPVGTVEFVRRWCEIMNLQLPESIGFPDFVHEFLDRKVRETTYENVLSHEFVKPIQVKKFIGGIKNTLTEKINNDELVWASVPVPFESEFRFYIHDSIPNFKILGWARYDDLFCSNPDPDLNMVNKIAKSFHDNLGPSAYSIDIGWRPDLQKYSLVEINDAWSLGFYQNADPQTKFPTRQQYADMLVSRWTQILFCSFF